MTGLKKMLVNIELIVRDGREKIIFDRILDLLSVLNSDDTDDIIMFRIVHGEVLQEVQDKKSIAFKSMCKSCHKEVVINKSGLCFKCYTFKTWEKKE